MADVARRRATYQDVLDAPAHKVAEILDGELHLQPRPALPHAMAASALGEELGPPFKRGRGGPGGWIIMDEPELHLGDKILVPDLAGWRLERLPEVDESAFTTVAPDWVCEILSRDTARVDRTVKRPIYAQARVAYLWHIDPIERWVETFALDGNDWLLFGTWEGDAKARIRPFDAIELDLAVLWAGVVLKSKP
jgi:Uma2 family endonuclease